MPWFILIGLYLYSKSQAATSSAAGSAATGAAAVPLTTNPVVNQLHPATVVNGTAIQGGTRQIAPRPMRPVLSMPQGGGALPVRKSPFYFEDYSA